MGRCIHAEVLGGVRAEYGHQVIASLAKALTADYGRGWSEQQLRHCLRVAEIFTDEAILSAARRELSWTHIKALIYIEDPIKREFYLELCRLERSAISRKPAEAIRHDLAQLLQEERVQPDVLLKDPYVLDFKGLKAVVQIAGASEKRRIHRCIIVLKGPPSRQRAQWYL